MTDLFKWSGDDVRGFDHEPTAFNPAFVYEGGGDASPRLSYEPTSASLFGKSPIGEPEFTAWRISWEFSGYPTSSKAIISPLDSTGASSWRVRMNPSGQLILDDGDNSARGTTAPIPIDQPVRIEILASTTEVSLRIYTSPTSDELIGDELVASTGTFRAVDNIRIGQTSGSPHVPVSKLDDVLITDEATWVGPMVKPTPAPGKKYAIIGDSLTSMSGANGEYLRQALLAADIPPVNVYLWGVGGKRIVVADLTGKTTEMNIEDAKKAFGHIDHWIIALGTNDRPQDDGTVNSDIDTLLTAVGTETKITWINLTSKQSATAQDIRVNGLIRNKLNGLEHAQLADWDTRIRSLDGGLNPSPYWIEEDNTHMSPQGYEERAKFYVEQLLDEPENTQVWDNLFVGSVRAEAVYIGSTQVWRA